MLDDPVGAPRLACAPALDVIPIGDDLLLHTDTATLRLEGGVARVVRDRVLPALEDAPSRDEILSSMHDLPVEELRRLLDHLLQAGIIVEVGEDEPADGVLSWTYLVTASRAERHALRTRTRGLRVVLVGLEAPGIQLAEALAAVGVGTIVLADPFPVTPSDAVALGTRQSTAERRQDLAAETLSRRRPDTNFVLSAAPLERDSVISLVAGTDLVVTSVDRGLSAARHWVNAGSLKHGVPSLHADMRGQRALVGPLVLPGEGPCYLCWRMRALACDDDFADAMALEEAYDAERRPRPVHRPTLPTLVPWVVAALAHEVLAVTTGATQPRLAAQVLELDGLSLTERLHAVLQRPDCPACQKKGHRPRAAAPTLDELRQQSPVMTNFERIAVAAVGPRCGLIRRLDRVPKDLTEPQRPYIVRAELANSRFLAPDEAFVSCSGKGRSLVTARNGAIGEALERYAALTWLPDRRVSASRRQLEGRSLDPRDLVLFADAQYEHLPYAPYQDTTILDWVPGRSLVSGEAVWVPLLAAHLGESVSHREAYLFPPTSNGFAAGATAADALVRALLEVIERDAFLIAWAHRLAGRRIDARTLPDEETRQVAEAYARRNVSIQLNLLPVDTAATVVLGTAWSDRAPAVVVGLGADLDPIVAARHAVMEVAQVRPALGGRLRTAEAARRLAELVEDPQRVERLEDHDLLYADPRTATALEFLLDPEVDRWDAGPAAAMQPADALERLVASLAAVAGDVLYVDITPDDVDSLGVRVVRGIVPGFQPIHFGAREARLGGRRFVEVPWRLGLAPRPARLPELNLAPHPLA